MPTPVTELMRNLGTEIGPALCIRLRNMSDRLRQSPIECFTGRRLGFS